MLESILAFEKQEKDRESSVYSPFPYLSEVKTLLELKREESNAQQKYFNQRAEIIEKQYRKVHQYKELNENFSKYKNTIEDSFMNTNNKFHDIIQIGFKETTKSNELCENLKKDIDFLESFQYVVKTAQKLDNYTEDYIKNLSVTINIGNEEMLNEIGELYLLIRNPLFIHISQYYPNARQFENYAQKHIRECQKLISNIKNNTNDFQLLFMNKVSPETVFDVLCRHTYNHLIEKEKYVFNDTSIFKQLASSMSKLQRLGERISLLDLSEPLEKYSELIEFTFISFVKNLQKTFNDLQNYLSKFQILPDYEELSYKVFGHCLFNQANGIQKAIVKQGCITKLLETSKDPFTYAIILYRIGNDKEDVFNSFSPPIKKFVDIIKNKLNERITILFDEETKGWIGLGKSKVKVESIVAVIEDIQPFMDLKPIPHWIGFVLSQIPRAVSECSLEGNIGALSMLLEMTDGLMGVDGIVAGFSSVAEQILIAELESSGCKFQRAASFSSLSRHPTDAVRELVDEANSTFGAHLARAAAVAALSLGDGDAVKREVAAAAVRIFVRGWGGIREEAGECNMIQAVSAEEVEKKVKKAIKIN